MTTQQVISEWAAQRLTSAHGSNIFFQGATIYSYGEHFPIARLYNGLILFTTVPAKTRTTKRHIGAVYAACVEKKWPLVNVDDVLKDQPCEVPRSSSTGRSLRL